MHGSRIPSSMSERLVAVVKVITAVCALRAMFEGYDIINTGVYTMPPTPTSHGSGYTPDGTTSGFTTDPSATFAHLSSPLRINVPSETTALSVLSPGMSSACAATRVMSPNDPSSMLLQANQAVLLGLQCKCQGCNLMSPDPSLCANCGAFGHPICIGVEFF